MLKNYFKIAGRHLLRNKSFSIINILGLAIGMACFLVIFLYVKGELGYDAFHEKGDRIYRMVLDRKYPGRNTEYAAIPHSYAISAKLEYPEIEESCRIFKFPGTILLKKGAEVFEEKERMWADSNFFNVFSFNLIKGDPNEVLKQPNTAVLTESMAKKYFGNEDPIGKVLEIPQNNNGLIVTGLCKDVPFNSHVDFDIVMSASTLNNFIQQPNHTGFDSYTYFLLKPGTNPKNIEAKFPDLVTKYASGEILRNFGVSYEEYQKSGNGYVYTLQPIKDIYLHSNLEGELKPAGSLTRVYIFTVIAIFILFIAIINFMNLATARSAERAKEVGIRKTLGSGKNEIAGQFLIEAITISLISAVLALGILQFLVPLFNEISGKSISLMTFANWTYPVLFVVGAVLIGLLSGSYPAFVLTSFKPLEVLKGKLFSTQKGAFLRNSLVVIQFVISVVLIIATIVVFRQLEFIQSKELGFDKENIIKIKGGFGLDMQKTQTFKEELRRMNGVAAVGSCNSNPGNQYFGVSFRAAGENEKLTGRQLVIDDEYIDCMGMEIVEGRGFSKAFADSNSVILNETALKAMAITDPIGKQVFSNDFSPQGNEEEAFTIVGIIKDFHFQSLHRNIEPLFLVNPSGNQGVNVFINVRIKPNNFSSSIGLIEDKWKTFAPEQPFRFSFMDSDLNALYEAEQTSKRVFGLFSLLAIFIACIGLLGLAAYITQRRTKEIGVRKVIGASTMQIVGLLSKDFLKLVFVALIIATPIAWFGMNRWLQDFAFAISISWWIFALAGIIAIGIAFLTVSFQSIKAAMANPINALKDE
jgi:putative ABC transport system permease protein